MDVLEYRDYMRQNLKKGARVSIRLDDGEHFGTVETIDITDAMAAIKWDDGTMSHAVCMEDLSIV